VTQAYSCGCDSELTDFIRREEFLTYGGRVSFSRKILLQRFIYDLYKINILFYESIRLKNIKIDFIFILE